MSNAISLINQFPRTKGEQNIFIEKAVDEVKMGIYNALDVEIYMKAFEHIASKIREQIKENTINEANKQGGKSFEYKGINCTLAEFGTKYNFSDCGDPVYNSLSKQLTALTLKIKEREAFLKAIPAEGIDHIDINTGECIKIYKPSKTSTTGLKINF